jgi:hypothetical protein
MPARGRSRSLKAHVRASVAVAALSLSGCYKPNVTDNGFLCATTGKACPDGYRCGSDRHCSLLPAALSTDSGADVNVMMTDAGGEPTCSSAPVTPLCAAGPAAGDVCSPACQRGCDCGRCNVVDGKPKCVPTGTVKLGDVCTPGAADNCGAGLICLIESCGNGLARCYRHCTSGDQCDGAACTIAIDDGKGTLTSFTTCDVPLRVCDPVAGTGCPDPALNCYLTSANQTLCDCPTKQGMNNVECMIYSDCAPGFVCTSGVGGLAGPHCHFACSVANPSCPPAAGDGGQMHCVPAGTGAKYGYCAM